MKLIHSFAQFLENEVNLNPDRLNTIEEGRNTVTNFLKANELFKDAFIDISPQGSSRQKTIIKPVTEEDEFDVDVLFRLVEFPDWEPRDYLNKLHNEFYNTTRYKDIVDRRGKTRCVTLDYANDFHIDIVPCIERSGQYYVMNKNDNAFEPTDGESYAEWFDECNSVTGNDYLIKVIRLMKYIRDYKGTFSVKSILLTTLVGSRVVGYDKAELVYSDLPTSFKTLFNRLDEYLQDNKVMPIVKNPVLPDEDFNRHWDQDKYANFREKVHFYNEKINRAYECDDLNESLKLWQDVFGGDYKLADADEDDLAKSATDITLGNASHQQPFPGTIDPRYNVSLRCLASRDGRAERSITSGAPIMKGYSLHYIADIEAGADYDEIEWQVVNTGDEAMKANCPRGNFFPAKKKDGSLSDNPRSNYESTAYEGLHWAQCFLVKNDVCVGVSDKFIIRVFGPQIRRRIKFK